MLIENIPNTVQKIELSIDQLQVDTSLPQMQFNDDLKSLNLTLSNR